MKKWDLTNAGPLGPWKPERSEIKVILPAHAAWILEHMNGHNRPLPKPSARTVEDALNNGTWECNGETIIIGWDPETGGARLEDGQGRLTGCVAADKPMKTWVCFRRPCPGAFMTIDRGTIRSNASDLGTLREKNCYDLAAVLLMLKAYDEGCRSSVLGSSPKTPTRELLDVLAGNPGIRDSVHWTVGRKPRIKAVPRAISLVHYLAGRGANPKVLARRDEFFERLADGANLPLGSPILSLRNRLDSLDSSPDTRMRRRGGAVGVFQSLWTMVRAWNAFVMGHEMSKIQMTYKDSARQIPTDIPDIRSYTRRPSEKAAGDELGADRPRA